MSRRLTKVRVSAPGNDLKPVAFGIIVNNSDEIEDAFVHWSWSTLVAVCPTREAQDAAYRLLAEAPVPAPLVRCLLAAGEARGGAC